MKKLNQYEQRYADAKAQKLAAIYLAKGEREVAKAEADADNVHLRKQRDLALLKYRTDKQMACLSGYGDELGEKIRELGEDLNEKLAAIDTAIENNNTAKHLADERARELVKAAEDEYAKEHAEIRAEEAAWEQSRKDSGRVTYGHVIDAVLVVRAFCRQAEQDGITVNMGGWVAEIAFKPRKEDEDNETNNETNNENSNYYGFES